MQKGFILDSCSHNAYIEISAKIERTDTAGYLFDSLKIDNADVLLLVVSFGFFPVFAHILMRM